MPKPGSLVAAQAAKRLRERERERAKREEAARLSAEGAKAAAEAEKVAAGQSLLQAWASDPDRYARDRFGPAFKHGLTPDQKRILLGLAHGDKRFHAVKAAGKVGKSRSAGLAVYWLSECHGYARINLMSATGQNLEEVLWQEILDLWDASQGAEHPLALERPPLDPKTGFTAFGCRVVGLTAAKVETLGGYGGAKSCWIVDEASSEKFDVLYDGVRHNTMAGVARVLLLGNPTRPVGVFHGLWRNSPEKALWERYTLAAAEKLPDGSVRAKYNYPDTGLSDQSAVMDLVNAHGVDSDFVKVRIFGEFAETGENGVCSMQWIEEATERYRRLCVRRDGRLVLDESNPRVQELLADQLHLGVDVAWTGSDDSAIYPRRGLLVLEPVVVHGRDPVQVAMRALEVVDRLGRPGEVVRVKVDTVGVGGGTWAYLQAAEVERESAYAREARAHAMGGGPPPVTRRLQAVAVNVGERPTSRPDDRSPGYVRLRDQVWFAGAYFIRDGAVLAPHARFEEDMLMPTYSYDAANRRQVESKEDVKKRLKRSPDLADAFNLAVFDGVSSVPAPPPPAQGPDWGTTPIGWPSSGAGGDSTPLGI